jgi:rSAM/selenodomain-associated transferase 2
MPSLKSQRGHDDEHPLSISVIIPTLDEQDCLAPTLATALSAPGVEAILVDGGSQDQTVAMARQAGAKVIHSPPGRARQMNLGAATAKGEALLFLHADTLLPKGWQHEVRRILEQPGVSAGAFGFRLDSRPAKLRFIELGVALRCRLGQMPYGDQALFMRREFFEKAGGFPQMPIMEDVALVKRLKKLGRVLTSPAPAITSARRWQAQGALYTTGLNYLLMIAFYAGIPLGTLRRLYDRT